MGEDPVIDGPGHARTVASYLEVFRTALIQRWRIDTAERYRRWQPIATNIVNHDARSCALNTLQLSAKPADDYAARVHRLTCDYVTWAESASRATTSPPARCRGRLPLDQQGRTHRWKGASVALGETVPCPIADAVQTLVPQWAAAECAELATYPPMFDPQRQPNLRTSRDALATIRNGLAVEGSDAGRIDLTGAGDLPSVIAKLPDGPTHADSWWPEWTGLAADALATGFLQTPKDVLTNHQNIAGALANLVSYRAAIIQTGRGNTLRAIAEATRALGVGAASTEQVVWHWKVLQGAAALFATVGGAPGAIAGGLIGLVGFIGENLFADEQKTFTYGSDFRLVVRGLGVDLAEATNVVETAEGHYKEAVADLRQKINAANSFELELYDLTENDAKGSVKRERHKGDTPRGGGLTVTVDHVMTIAKLCGQAGKGYEELLAEFTDVAKAGTDLSDKDGRQREPDKDLVALIEEFKGYMTTASARYFLARDQIEAAAKAYDDADTRSKGDFERVMADGQMKAAMDYRPDFDAAKEAADTKRPDGANDDPYGDYTTAKDPAWTGAAR